MLEHNCMAGCTVASQLHGPGILLYSYVFVDFLFSLFSLTTILGGWSICKILFAPRIYCFCVHMCNCYCVHSSGAISCIPNLRQVFLR